MHACLLLSRGPCSHEYAERKRGREGSWQEPFRIWNFNTYLYECDNRLPQSCETFFCKPSGLSFTFIWLPTRHCPKNVYQKPGREIVIWFHVFISFKWKNLACHWQQKAGRFGSMVMLIWVALTKQGSPPGEEGDCSSFSWDSQN